MFNFPEEQNLDAWMNKTLHIPIFGFGEALGLGGGLGKGSLPTSYFYLLIA